MNNLSYNNLLLVGLIFTFLLLNGCKHDHSHEGDNHDHGDSTEVDDHAEEEMGNKTVHLNKAQFQYAEIDTGWFDLKNISEVVNASGYTKLDPQDEADVNVPIEGNIISVHVIEGNFVKRGQTLATMTSLAYNDIKLEKSKLQEELSNSEANLTYLQEEYNRQQALAAENINAQKVFQKVSAELQKERSKVKLVNEQISILDQSLAIISPGGGNKINIKAPISGFITDLNVKIGTIASPGTPLFSIVDNSQMHVDLLVYEKDLGKIKEGQTVRFILTNQSNKEIKGEIYNIGKSFANDTKSVAVHADIEKNDANLIPGMYINALIDVGANKVETLPEGAIVNAEGRHFIFLWEAENIMNEKEENGEIHFTRIEVKTGANQLGHIEVIPLDKIPDGDKIVVGGAYYLQSHLLKSDGGGGHHH